MVNKKKIEIPEADQKPVLDKDGIPINVAHCMKQDRWVSKNEVEVKSSYPSKAY